VLTEPARRSRAQRGRVHASPRPPFGRRRFLAGAALAV